MTTCVCVCVCVWSQASRLEAENIQLSRQLAQSVAEDSLSARLEQQVRQEVVALSGLQGQLTALQEKVRLRWCTLQTAGLGGRVCRLALCTQPHLWFASPC